MTLHDPSFPNTPSGRPADASRNDAEGQMSSGPMDAGSERVPPNWPKAARPLRVAILGWARLAAQQWEGSGYNWSASELARGLAMSGHTVTYLASGMTYRLTGGPRIRLRERWCGVACHDIVNSPNLSPSAANFQNVTTETSSPELTALVLRWLDGVDAQVVHIHSLEGYGLDLIGAIRASGRPVVVTPHNYWYVCPQVDLLHQEARVCADYEGGNRCVNCLPTEPARRVMRRRALLQTLERVMGPYRTEVLRQSVRWARDRALRRGGRPKHTPHWATIVDPEAALGFEHLPAGAWGGGAADPNPAGVVKHDLPLMDNERPKDYEAAPADQNERFLSADHHLNVLNNYGTRRLAGIEALNRASLVIPPSDFLRLAHVKMGLEPARSRWVRLGQPHFDQINRKARRSPFYDTPPWDPATARRPLRLAFFGTVRPNKGLEVLARAIPLLETSVRQRCQITIRALGYEWPFRKRLSLYPEVAVFGGFDVYQLIGSGGDYDVGILPHIWFENSPLVMLEHLHAGKFVISSRLGGPPDWIDPPRNGLLFPAGDAAALARCITDLATGAVRIPSPREIHRATVLQSYPAHVREVEAIYHEVLEHPDPSPSRGQGDRSGAHRPAAPTHSNGSAEVEAKLPAQTAKPVP